MATHHFLTQQIYKVAPCNKMIHAFFFLINNAIAFQ